MDICGNNPADDYSNDGSIHKYYVLICFDHVNMFKPAQQHNSLSGIITDITVYPTHVADPSQNSQNLSTSQLQF